MSTRILVAEDEVPARERLCHLLTDIDPTATIAAAVGSVRDVQAVLEGDGRIDLAVVDIQLSDGVSFEALRSTQTTVPVIFTTAYDEFMPQAFSGQGIAYLLKPIRRPDLDQAYRKFLQLRTFFAAHQGADEPAMRECLMVRRGRDHVRLPLTDVAYFRSISKVVLAVDRSGRQYITDHTLQELERMVDVRSFYRMNRQMLVHADVIRSYRQDTKGRCLVDLSVGDGSPVVVSQERAVHFKAWLLR